MDDSPIEEFRSPTALRFQRRTVLMERIGWVGMLALILAALGGLLGPGPLSHTEVQSTDGTVAATYSGFVHNGATTSLDLTLTLDDPAEPPSILLDTDYLDVFSISDVRPTPTDVIARGRQTEFVFAAPDTAEVLISFDLSAQEIGRAVGSVVAGDGAAVRVAQFIYP